MVESLGWTYHHICDIICDIICPAVLLPVVCDAAGSSGINGLPPSDATNTKHLQVTEGTGPAVLSS